MVQDYPDPKFFQDTLPIPLCKLFADGTMVFRQKATGIDLINQYRARIGLDPIGEVGTDDSKIKLSTGDQDELNAIRQKAGIPIIDYR